MPEWLQDAIRRTADAAILPVRVPLELVGFRPANIQIFTFFVGVLLLFLTWSFSRSIRLLRSKRRGQAAGTVIAIDRRGDYPTPVIRFTDRQGRRWEFDSELPTNANSGRVGASVGVTYDTDNPSRAHETGRIIYRSIIVAGLLAFTTGVFAFSFGLVPMKAWH